MHGGSILWADREPAPTCPMMSNYVRTLYEWLLPLNTSGAFDRELLEKVVTTFRRKSCKAVNEYKSYAKHRKDLRTARIRLLVYMVLDRLRSIVSCWVFVSSNSSCCLRALHVLWLDGPLTRPPFIRLQKLQVWGTIRVH